MHICMYHIDLEKSVASMQQFKGNPKEQRRKVTGVTRALLQQVNALRRRSAMAFMSSFYGLRSASFRDGTEVVREL